MERATIEDAGAMAQSGEPHASHLHWDAAHETPAGEVWCRRSARSPTGVGCLTDFFYGETLSTRWRMPIFAIAMKMDPFKLGIALAATKIVGRVDGSLRGGRCLDNLRSPWGRRRPFISRRRAGWGRDASVSVDAAATGHGGGRDPV